MEEYGDDYVGLEDAIRYEDAVQLNNGDRRILFTGPRR